MKYLLRFLLVYTIVIFSIFSFYFTTIQKYYTDLDLISNELKGLEYLKKLYLFTNNIVEYKFTVDLKKSRKNLGDFELVISQQIDSLRLLRKENFDFYDDLLSKELDKIESFTFTDSDFYELLELINNESYRIGDKAGLFFQANRKIYYLNSLITHYLPEYIIRVSITKNIADFKLKNGVISDDQRNIYIEQNKLVLLSLSELKTIIKFLEPYEDTKIIQKIIQKITIGLENISDKEQDFSKYFDELTTVLLYSYRLNKATVNNLETSYKNRKQDLNNKITFYTSLLFFLFLAITLLFVYFKTLFDMFYKLTLLWKWRF